MKNKTKTNNLSLFISFMKIGAFSFGGGHAMIPIIQKETVETHNWITDDDVLEMIAISETTPGPIAINMATFIGYKINGFWGAFSATFGVVLPSFLIISLLSLIISFYANNEYVKYAFWGIRAGVLALIAKALINMYKKVNKNVLAYIIMGLTFLFAAILNVNVIFVLIGCAIIGIISALYMRRRGL